MFDRVLLIPVFNPSPGWEENFVDKYQKFCRQLQSEIPVVLSNDGSSSDIQSGVDFIINKLGDSFFYIHNPINKGKGAALKEAAKLLQAKNYIFTDVDFPYTIGSMVNVMKTLEQKSGVVMGVRQKTYYNDVNRFRTYLSKFLKWLNKGLIKLPSNDTQCGLKAFDIAGRDILSTCKTDRFLIDLEFLLASHHKKLVITPVEVELRQDIRFTNFNSVILLKELSNFIRLVIRYRFLQ